MGVKIIHKFIIVYCMEESNDQQEIVPPNELIDKKISIGSKSKSKKSKTKGRYNFVIYYLIPIISFFILLLQFTGGAEKISKYFYSPNLEVVYVIDTTSFRSGKSVYIENVGNQLAEEIYVRGIKQNGVDSVLISPINEILKGESNIYKIDRLLPKQLVGLRFFGEIEKRKDGSQFLRDSLNLPGGSLYHLPIIYVSHKGGKANYYIDTMRHIQYDSQGYEIEKKYKREKINIESWDQN